MNNNMEIRVAMIGPQGVGKTEILRRLSNQNFRPAYHPTVRSEVWTIDVQGIRFIVTEYSGQEIYWSVPQEELDAITACIMVTSGSRRDIAITAKLTEKIPNNIPFCLVANKTDVYPNPNPNNIVCCAKTNHNLEAPFMHIAEYYINN